ncbi:MAG: hypothetical protein WD042_04060, partial [Phycisphaeraceae bacterium]
PGPTIRSSGTRVKCITRSTLATEFIGTPGNQYGFDNTVTPHWISTEANTSKTTHPSLIVQPSSRAGEVTLSAADSGKISVAPGQVAQSPQPIDLASKISTKDISSIYAYWPQFSDVYPYNKLHVAIYPMRYMTVACHIIDAPGLTPTSNPGTQSLSQNLNTIWCQAVVSVSVKPVVTDTVNYDLNGNGKLDLVDNEELAIINAARDPTAQINVYIVKAFAALPDGSVPWGYRRGTGTDIFVRDGYLSNTIAHEIGHVLGLGHPTPSGDGPTMAQQLRQVMYGEPTDTGTGTLLVKTEWDAVHP